MTMDCRKVQDLLSDYLENGPSGDELSRVAAHLEACPECAAVAMGLRQTLALLSKLPAEPAPPALLEGVTRRLARERGPSGASRGGSALRLALRRPLPAAAAAVVALLAYGVYRSVPAPPAPSRTPVPARSSEAVKESLSRAPAPPAAPAPAASLAASPAPAASRTPSAPPGERVAARSAHDEVIAPAPHAPASRLEADAERPAAGPDAGEPPRQAGSRRPAYAARPAVPASRVSTFAEPIAPPSPPPAERMDPVGRAAVRLEKAGPAARSAPPRIALAPLPGPAVVLEIDREAAFGIRARVSEAARRHGGFAHGGIFESGAGAGESEGDAPAPVQVHVPAAAAAAFLDDLGRMGTVLSAAGDEEPGGTGPSGEGAFYAVRFRIR